MDFSVLNAAGPVIQIHVLTAVLAAVLGPVALLRRKRDMVHKTVGYVWMSAMLIAALSSFFIWTLRVVGLFSPIHILSVITVVGVVLAVLRIRKRDVIGHKRVVWRLYSQAIGIAGAFSFLPGRAMNKLFVFGDPWVVFGLAVAGFGGAVWMISRRFQGGVPV